MQQHELEQRYRVLARHANIERMRCDRREDMSGPQFGIIVNSDVTIWAGLPADPTYDASFVKDLCNRAKALARKQD